MTYQRIISQLRRRSPKIMNPGLMSPGLISPNLMGVLNVTPDSFSDGGRYVKPQIAMRQALSMIQQGATIIDVGGESSRPGAKPVSVAEELRRVVPVVQLLNKKIVGRKNNHRRPLISIDTYKPVVAAVALQLGADMVNDITGLRDPGMRQVIAQAKCPVVLMHMLGDPQTMQTRPRYKNVIKDISHYFRTQIKLAKQSGIAPDQIILDPGIGFGKTVQHNLDILTHVDAFKKHFPDHLLLIGASRKSFIGQLTGTETADRLPGTLAAHIYAAQHGADILRVHDVAEHAQALRVWRAIDSIRYQNINS